MVSVAAEDLSAAPVVPAEHRVAGPRSLAAHGLWGVAEAPHEAGVGEHSLPGDVKENGSE